MNLNCFFGHKWEYYNQDVIIDPPGRIVAAALNIKTNTPIIIKNAKSIRRCIKCGFKQKELNNSKNSFWVEDSLTPEEKRDKKINDILK